MSKAEKVALAKSRLLRCQAQARAAMLAGDKRGCARWAERLTDAEDRLAKVEAK